MYFVSVSYLASQPTLGKARKNFVYFLGLFSLNNDFKSSQISFIGFGL